MAPATRVGMPATAEFVEIQRSRLLAGALRAIDEVGYPGATVTQITSRARVSRRTFYELFADREACLLALIDECVEMLERELADAGLAGRSWRERVRGGLALILSFLDREPALARVCVLQAQRGGPLVLERRREILGRLVAALDEGRREAGPRTGDCTPLTAEGLVGAAFWIVSGRLAERERERERDAQHSRGDSQPLSALLGQLTSMIVLPYLGAAAARREQARSTSKAPPAPRSVPAPTVLERDPLQEVPMRLTYRTARVLQAIAQRPGISNREIAQLAGIHDQGQISKLLARLQRLGLTANTGTGHLKGEPNAWKLTVLGEQLAQRISMSIARESEAA